MMLKKAKWLVPEFIGGYRDNVWSTAFVKASGCKSEALDRRKPLFDWVERGKPKNYLEIGLGSGTTLRQVMKIRGDECNYYCCDILKLVAAREVFDELKGRVHFIIGDTKETLPKIHRELPKMDVIYIDGGHDYETVQSDWEYCKKLMHDGTAVFFDDLDYFAVVRVIDDAANDGFHVKVLKQFNKALVMVA